MNPPDYPRSMFEIYSQKFFSFTLFRNISVPESVCASALDVLIFKIPIRMRLLIAQLLEPGGMIKSGLSHNALCITFKAIEHVLLCSEYSRRRH